jgi:hypothetical protein
VTPPGDTATEPGAAVGVSEVADVPEVTVACDDDAVGSPSDPDEHPAMNAPKMPNVANVPVAAMRRECLRMPANLCNGPILTRLANFSG